MRGKSTHETYTGGRSYQHNNNSSKSQMNKKQNITFLLIGHDRVGISVNYSIFTSGLKELIKQKYQATWNNDGKVWEIAMQNYKDCLKDVTQLFKNEQGTEPNIVKIPQFVFKAENEMQLDLQIKNSPYSVVRVIKYNQLQTSIEPRVLPFYYKLFDFQKASLDFGIKRHGRLLLADEMGVGKTIQSIALASIYRHEWPFLVICPSSLRLNWQQEIVQWLSDYLKKTQIQVYSKGGTPIRQTAKVLIVSYDLAWKIRDSLEQFQVVIADQAHYLKNSGNKRSDTLTPFLSSRKRVILLSGTPALAKPRQIFNLISIVRPDIFTNFKQFGHRYCDPTMNPWSHALEYNGCQNSKQLHYLINDKLMIRRLKKDVLTQLPDKMRQKVHVQTDKNVIKEIKQILNSCGGQSNMDNLVMEMLYKFDSNEPATEDTRQAISMAYSLTGKAKLESIKQYVLELLSNDIKFLIFAHHKIVLDGLQAALKEKKVKFMRIDGSITKEVRHANVTNFQEDPSIKVALLSITAAGVGLTLTAASTVVFAQLHWTPGIMIQAEDRAHRIGQKSSVNCHYLIGENSLDDILYRNLEKKVNNVSSFVDGKSQKLQIENMGKGQKGKISVKAKEDKNPNRQSLLYRFQSMKPMLDKYAVPEFSQDTDISATGPSPNGDIDSDNDHNEDQRSTKNKKSKRQPLQVEVHDPIMEIQSYHKESQHSDNDEKQKGEGESGVKEENKLEQRQSSQICDFIMANANELFSYTQNEDSDNQTQSLH